MSGEGFRCSSGPYAAGPDLAEDVRGEADDVAAPTPTTVAEEAELATRQPPR